MDNGQSVRLRGKGEPGINGGPRGDLLVEVIVARHPIFQRQDMNIYSTAPISFVTAALGGTVRIKTVDGEVEYDVKPGTQTDTRVRLKGKGVPSVRNKNVRGDHYVTLVVQVPTDLSREAKEALRAYEDVYKRQALMIKGVNRKAMKNELRNCCRNIRWDSRLSESRTRKSLLSCSAIFSD